MKYEINKGYRTKAFNDSTSIYGYNKSGISSVNNTSTSFNEFRFGKYIDVPSQNFNIFANVFNQLNIIHNSILRERLLYFISVFMYVLSKYNGMTNIFPAFVMSEDEDSIFLEWVYHDFRIGFTFCNVEEESMWFLISNSNLEELSVSGLLRKSDYYPIISKVVEFVLGNT